MRPILRGGALMKHFPSAVHWNTREAALPRRMASWIFGTARIIRARHGNIWHGTDSPDWDIPVFAGSVILKLRNGEQSHTIAEVSAQSEVSGHKLQRSTLCSNGAVQTKSKAKGNILQHSDLHHGSLVANLPRQHSAPTPARL